jgi:hypothetical protein
MFTYDDMAPHGYNENGMYVSDKLHDEYAKGREEREKLRKEGKLDPYTGRSVDEGREETRNLYD